MSTLQEAAHYVHLWARLLLYLTRSQADPGKMASLKFRWQMWREHQRDKGVQR